MVCSSLDPCFFYKVADKQLQGIQVTLVDDSLGGGTEEFSKLELEKSKKFECKLRDENMPIKFNEMWLEGSQKNA